MCIRDRSTTVTTFSDYLATKALEPTMREKIFSRNRGIVRQNLATFTEWVESHHGVLSFTPPAAGCFAFVKYDLPIPSWDLVMDMVENNSVFVIPGSCFEMCIRDSLMTCLIATCPGGITQLASIAEDLGADPLKVSLLHLVRLLTIYVILPPLIKALV